jgi:ABC-type Fe3+/spermidine/putrescine transport system ATPase subunit
MVFQSYALFNHMTVAENIKFGLEVRNLAVDRDKRVGDLLELVQLTGLGARYPRQVSRGGVMGSWVRFWSWVAGV